MSDYDYINWVLNRDLICKNQGLMKEDKQAATHKAQIVRIDKGPGVTGYTLYEFAEGRNSELLKFFNASYGGKDFQNAPKGLTSFCDYIIISECSNQTFIILVELKRGKDRPHAAKQLAASKLFMDYVLQSAERIKEDNDMDDFSPKKIQFRRVIIENQPKSTLRSHYPEKINRNDVFVYHSNGLFDIRQVIGKI